MLQLELSCPLLFGKKQLRETRSGAVIPISVRLKNCLAGRLRLVWVFLEFST